MYTLAFQENFESKHIFNVEWFEYLKCKYNLTVGMMSKLE
jgi:hypothetical protein